jgi:hypothetical protein
MTRRAVDLASHLNQTIERGHPADFPVGLEPVFRQKAQSFERVLNRVAVVRKDTSETLAVVSDRYTLLPHQRILDLVQEAIAPLDAGPVPQGIYVDRGGVRMRAVFKFPALARPVTGDDEICPCLKIQNTYDGTTRISVHIGAFRFVCTNLAVGGGGFMSVHAGDIPIEEAATQLASYLAGFENIVSLYRSWAERPLDQERMADLLDQLPKRPAEDIRQEVAQSPTPTVYAAYNAATRHATHRMRSFRGAFELLERINRGFQEHFPAPAA